jgi:multidrug resistance efflux pump
MAQSKNGTIDVPLAQRLADFRSRTLPIVVWSACAIAVTWMLIGRASRFEYLGLAQSQEYPISSIATGTVETVVVDLYDRVEAGEMVAKLDDSYVLASIATANATISQLQAELGATRARLMTDTGQGMADWTDDLRRFKMDEEQRRLDLLSLKVKFEEKQIELERLQIEEQRARGLLDAGVVAQDVWDLARLHRDEVRQGLEESRVLLNQTDQEYESAKARREEFERSLKGEEWMDPLLQPLRQAVEVESRRLSQIELQRQGLVLRSPVSGQVSQILCSRGQSVTPGEPIVVVAEDSVREIIAFLAEDDGRPVGATTPVLVSTRTKSGTVAESVVLRVSPTIQELPPRLWRNPRVPDYGRPVVIAAAPAMRLTPGEIVNVKFLFDR